MERITYFVDVLLPLPLPGLFTYRIPHEFDQQVGFGMRVVVPFGRSKLYSGLVVRVHTDAPSQVNTKYIIDTIDASPIITEKQFRFWQWLSSYYLCSLGEVMMAALPSALKLASETKVMISPDFDGELSILNEKESKIVETLSYHHTLTVDEVSKIIEIKKVIPIIKTLVEKGVLITDEEIKNPYKSKKESFVSLAPPYNINKDALYELLGKLENNKRSAKQVDLILAFMMLLQERQEKSTDLDLTISIPKAELLQRADASLSRLNTLIEKGIFEVKEFKVSRLLQFESKNSVEDILLSNAQEKALREIEQQSQNYPAVLLHGITGSGKTEIYIKLIDKVLRAGKQVLYLLPEIALTSQIVDRLRRYFGDKVGVYHSRFNEYERVEIWDRVLYHDPKREGGDKYQLILGARSALLLPYQNLGLIIVDEEHDSSYKQIDPAPRYHARDSAIVLGKIHRTYTLLGSATPSLESYYNVKQQKYGLVELMQRYANSTLPEIWTVNLTECLKQKKIEENFSSFLLESIEEALAKKEQIIIFQNRRGFALRLFCHTCQSIPSCKYCDVTLTYHKGSNLLRCHYCGYAIEVPDQCPECGSKEIEMKGFGTERVEETLAHLFPNARIARMDVDTTRSKNAYRKILSDFENHNTDILVGTQMVTKGLDFDRVTVVGILNADSLISFPDFRSFERAFQLMAQVSGRAGRKEKSGKVIIQAYNPAHPALEYVVVNDFKAMYEHQMSERRQFFYPPFYRLIKITLKHKEEKNVLEGAKILASRLRESFPGKVLGPEFPLVGRIQNLYLQDIWIKMPKNDRLEFNKRTIRQLVSTFLKDIRYKSIRVIINVDP